MQLPITYYGGKGIMIQNILQHFPEAGSYDIYVEAYGGSGRMLFEKPSCPIEIYNDAFYEVYALYAVLQDKVDFEKFRRMAELSIFSEELSDKYRQELRTMRKADYDTFDRVDIAYRYWYVNRTRRGGGLGGLKVNTVIRRKTSKSLADMFAAVDGLEDIYSRIQSCIFLNRDALELIPQWDRTRTLLYLDPPYHHSTRTSARYDLDVEDEHHEQLVETLLNIKNALVLLSGYDNKVYEKLEEANWVKVKFTVNTVSGTNQSKQKTECLWKNYE